MNRKICMLIAAGLIVGLSLFAVGCEMCCNSSKGSGSMVITDPKNASLTHKATFSYRVECVGSYEDTPEANAARKVTGRLEYHDHGLWEKTLPNKETVLLTVALHAEIDNVVNTLAPGEIVVRAAWEAMKTGGKSYYDFLPPFNYKDTRQTEIYCSKTVPNLVIFRGKYTPQPKELGEEGVVSIMVMDLGKPGASNEDRFEIFVDNGVFQGYHVRGALTGGNIKAL